jgi:hypothetical protein
MRKLLLLAASCAALLLVLAPPARAADVIEASSSVAFSQDPGFEGLYKYTVIVTWSLESHDLGHLDLFLDLAAFNDTCNGEAVRFPYPAGYSTGEDDFGQSCNLNYRGEFLCKTDPSIPFDALGATVKFEPLEVGCYTGETGSGRFVFYSSVPPSLSGQHPNAVAIKHGREVDFGGAIGSLPQSPLNNPTPQTAPVVINEFLVRPQAPDVEFVEILNVSGAPVDLTGWSIQVFNRDYSTVSLSQFAPGDSLLPEGFGTQADSTFDQFCYNCQYYLAGPRVFGTEGTAAVGEDFLFDAGGIILLLDDSAQVIDQVAYGNAGSAPISCPIVVPAGYSRPPGFGGAVPGFDYDGSPPGAMHPDQGVAEPETLSTSTNRFPDGYDTNNDGADFNIGAPTPDAANQAAPPDLGSSTRINSVYVYPLNSDVDPLNESLQFYNPTPAIKDVRTYRISDGYLIQPIFQPGDAIPLEPAQKYTVYHGLNGTISFEFEEEDRVDLYEERPNGLVRIDQLGWSRLPTFFPDSCFTRVPDGVGPSGGWDWDTSGGFVFLFYQDGCGLEAPNVGVEPLSGAVSALAPPWPNPARGAARFEFAVGQQHGRGATAQVAVYDVAGRRVRVFGEGTYPPGRHTVIWDGTADDGRPAAPGVYFARLFVAGRPAGEVRTVVWLRD